MNYQEMSDFEINKIVAVLSKEKIHGYDGEQILINIDKCQYFDPCNSWADAGPIIQENGISLYHYYDGKWDAEIEVSSPIGVFGTDEICVKFATHKNPLRAAMIVFIMMKDKENE